jgi:short-subunit dehydrogenase
MRLLMPEPIISIPPATPLNPRKRAILVGASSGIGAALARRLAREGYTVACLARRADLLQTLCDEINRSSGETRAVPYTHDVTNHKVIPQLFKDIVTDFGGLDLFIFCAGISLPVGLENFDFEKDRATTEANYIGALAWLNPVAELFQGLKKGQIVGISSVAGERGRVGNPSYNASKAALSCYLEALRNRLTRHGVHVLTVKPGFVQTDMVKDAKNLFWVVSPEQASEAIWKGIRKHKQDIYVPARWRLVMWIIRNIPSVIFRRMNF